MFNLSSVRRLILPALLCLSASAHAGLVVYTSEADFRAATTAHGVDDYSGLSITGTTASPMQRSAGTWTYTVSAPNLFYGAGGSSDPWLSTNRATDTVTFNGFANGAQAIGGNFFASTVAGKFTDGSVTLVATDSSGSIMRTIVGASLNSFLGFVSTDSLVSLELRSLQQVGASIWPTADKLIIAQRIESSDVPEPGSIALMLTGLSLFGLHARRRG